MYHKYVLMPTTLHEVGATCQQQRKPRILSAGYPLSTCVTCNVTYITYDSSCCWQTSRGDFKVAAVLKIDSKRSCTQVRGWLCCKIERLQVGLKQSALAQAFQEMDSMQLAAYCIAMLAEYLPEQWLAELRDIFQVPSSGMLYADSSTTGNLALIVFLAVKKEMWPSDTKLKIVMEV